MSYCDGRDYNDNGCLDSVPDRNERVREMISSQEGIYSRKQCKPIVFCPHLVKPVDAVVSGDNPFKIEKPFPDYTRFVMETYGFSYKAQKA